MIILKAFERLEKSLDVIPVDILKKLRINKYKEMIIENDVKNTKNLFTIFCSIFQFIAKEENLKIEDDILIDYTTLSIADYFSRVFYDGVFDHKEMFKLPCANLCYKEYILHAGKLKININPAVAKTEAYYYTQNVLNIGGIEIGIAREMEKNWTNFTDGFATSIYNIEYFVSKYVKNDFWIDFFYFYLLWRQILDDSNDFAEDYSNNELKSFGIFALLKKFSYLNYVNLKNPIISIKFKLYVLNNYKEIYADLIKRFEEELAKKIKVADFYKTIEKIEAFLPC